MKLSIDFYTRDVLEVAPGLLGKRIVRITGDGRHEYIITETEAYRGSEDLACHACKGRTARTEMLFHEGGRVYVYFIYGMHWMLNIVTGNEGVPQAALIRSVAGVKGPGRVARELQLDRSFYGEDLITSDRLWLEEGIKVDSFLTGKRIGVNYAGNYWANLPWRYYIEKL
jgi:DNA-3-methyladenine glycosylase